jgi:hypothetical protein
MPPPSVCGIEIRLKEGSQQRNIKCLLCVVLAVNSMCFFRGVLWFFFVCVCMSLSYFFSKTKWIHYYLACLLLYL